MRSSITLSKEHYQEIEEGANKLLAILKDPSCELMGAGYAKLKDRISPILNSIFAEQIIKKYNELFVNFANSHNITLLHLLILFAPHFAPLVIEDKNFTRINFRVTSTKNKLSASALDMAISRWLEGECEFQLIELLLKYRAKVPVSRDACFPYVTLPTGICLSVLFNQTAKRTVGEAASVLALLGCYGYNIHDELDAFIRTWFLKDYGHADRIVETHGFSLMDQLEMVVNFKEQAVKRFFSFNKKEPEFLVSDSLERLAPTVVPRRYSSLQGFRLYANPAQQQSSVAAVVFGDDNRLSDEDEGLANLFSPLPPR